VLAVVSSPRYTGNVVRVPDTKYLLDNSDEVKDEYNANIDNIPGFFKTLFGNEIITLNVKMDDGSDEVLYIKTRKGKITSIDDVLENSTLLVWADENTIDNISASDDQIKAINKALKDDKLSYEAVSFKTKLKTTLAGLGFIVWNLIN
jgi:hypothetical protein